jgi:hypothetical protein
VKAATLFAGLLLAVGWAASTRADDNTIAGAELTYSHDSNFMASPADAPSSPDSSVTYSGYVGHYWPSDDLRSAFVLRGDAALVRQNTFTTLNSTDYGGSVGYYHAFNPHNVLTASAGALARRFSDRSFDSNTGSFQAGLRQKLSDTVWLRESASVERSNVATDDFSYKGRTLVASATWGPSRSAQLSLSASWWGRTYDGAPGARRNGREVGAAWVQQLGSVIYVRTAIARQKNETLTGVQYESTTYSLGVGFSM